MSLYWGRAGHTWQPEGGERREWRDLNPGDLIENSRKIWRVHEVRLVPVIDWDDADREHFESWRRTGVAEEDWKLRPVYLVVSPVAGGKKRHVKVRPYGGLSLGAYVLHPHYPVCTECGEPWPCPEIGITRQVRQESAEVERLAAIMPGCCWSCGEPVTRRHSAMVFDGENLLLPGAPPPVFHLRSKGGCRAAAMKYEERWVAAADGRKRRLSCPGRIVRHVDGQQCDRDDCPGSGAFHAERAQHVITDGGELLRWVKDCPRCSAAAERDSCRWFTDDEIRERFPGWYGTPRK